METHSDDYPDFKPDLPTRFAGQDQTPLAKDGVVECDIPVTDEGKSEKIVPVEEKTESVDVEMASKPTETETSAVVDAPAPLGDDAEFDLKDEQIVLDPFHVTMLTKGDFRRAKHVKSGRYYLPEIFPLSLEGRKSMLLSNLITQANFLLCAATYQRCFMETPMIRLHSPNIYDFKPLKILYSDTSFLLVNEGKPVGIKVPTEISVEWLDSRKDDEKDLVDRSKCMDLESDWATVTEPNLTEYLNIHLYFKGHLDSDQIKDVETPSDPTIDKLADSYVKLGSQCAVVNVSSNKEPELPMDTLIAVASKPPMT